MVFVSTSLAWLPQISIIVLPAIPKHRKKAITSFFSFGPKELKDTFIFVDILNAFLSIFLRIEYVLN
jgi:hypothetical protein